MEETTDSGSIICPHCEFEETYSGDPLAEDESTEEECSSCGKQYDVVAKYNVTHHCRSK